MFARPFRPCALAVAASLALAACGTTASLGSRQHVSSARVSPLTPTSRVYTAEQIRRTGALTAWDAVRSLVPAHRLSGYRDGPLRAFGPRHAGSSIQLILDGHPMLDMEPLQSIPATEVLSLRILSASEAALYAAGGWESGAILVQTRGSLR